MDAKKTAFLFIMNFQILVLRGGLGPGELRYVYLAKQIRIVYACVSVIRASVYIMHACICF